MKMDTAELRRRKLRMEQLEPSSKIPKTDRLEAKRT